MHNGNEISGQGARDGRTDDRSSSRDAGSVPGRTGKAKAPAYKGPNEFREESDLPSRRADSFEADPAGNWNDVLTGREFSDHPSIRKSAPVGFGPESCGPFDPHIDLIPEHSKIDRLGQKRLGAVLQRLTLGLRIAIGGDHDDWDVWSYCLGLGQEFKTAHPRHVDVGQDQDE